MAREKPLYNEEIAQSVLVTTNWAIRVSRYQHLRAFTKDEYWLPIHRGYDGQVLKAHERNPNNKNDRSHSCDYLHQ